MTYVEDNKANEKNATVENETFTQRVKSAHVLSNLAAMAPS